jgi:hypothetical protein
MSHRRGQKRRMMSGARLPIRILRYRLTVAPGLGRSPHPAQPVGSGQGGPGHGACGGLLTGKPASAYLQRSERAVGADDRQQPRRKYLNPLAQYLTDIAPDMVAKITFEPRGATSSTESGVRRAPTTACSSLRCDITRRLEPRIAGPQEQHARREHAFDDNQC